MNTLTKKIILVTLMSPFILVWAFALLLSEIFNEAESLTGALLDKVGKKTASVLKIPPQ